MLDRLRRTFFTEGPEIVGNPDCPVMYRWTLMDGRWKILVHHFLPNGDDPHPHDHPRNFVTLILAGDYVDESYVRTGPMQGQCTRERMARGRVRRRSAEHLHRTLVGPRGCWSVVAMGPIQRKWGFHWLGKWWPWKVYLDECGEAALRCPE